MSVPDILDGDNSLDGVSSNAYDPDLTAGDDSAILDSSITPVDDTDHVSSYFTV